MLGWEMVRSRCKCVLLFGAMKDIAGSLYQSYQSGQRAGVATAPTRKQQTRFLRHRHGRRKRLVEHSSAIPRAGVLE
jgi:hypothetical protein